jgi:hypothetical protein
VDSLAVEVAEGTACTVVTVMVARVSVVATAVVVVAIVAVDIAGLGLVVVASFVPLTT